jgi:hypothetical membrane protein
MGTMDRSAIESPAATLTSRVEPPADARASRGERPADTRPSPLERQLLLWCGIVGSVLFTATFLVEGATRPGYDPWRQPISALSLGEGGWVQAVNFVVFGLLLACFARGLGLALAPGAGSKWAPRLQVIAALGLIIDGLFAQDPALGYSPGVATPAVASGHAPLHQLGATLVFTALPLRCFVLARRFALESRVDRRWRGWAAYSVATGVVFWALLAAFAVASGTPAGPAGLFEKLASIVMSVYGISLASMLLAAGGRLSMAPRSPEEQTR